MTHLIPWPTSPEPPVTKMRAGAAPFEEFEVEAEPFVCESGIFLIVFDLCGERTVGIDML